MSHIFLSYKREDGEYLENLQAHLKRFSIPYWADFRIEAGEDWREEIDERLKEAFAIAVIVTPRSMESHYVTYEWSWAIGHDVPVLPLLFEKTPSSLIHPRLADINQVKCYPTVPETLLETITRHQKGSPLVLFIERHISSLFLPMRFAVRMMLWTYSLDRSDLYTSQTNLEAVQNMIFELNEIENKIPQFWLQSYHTFPTAQKKKLQDLTEQLSQLHYAFLKGISLPLHLDEIGEFLVVWHEGLEPLLKQLAGYADRDYRQLDEALMKIEGGTLPIDPKRGGVELFLCGLQLPLASGGITPIIERIIGYSLRPSDDWQDVPPPEDLYDEET